MVIMDRKLYLAHTGTPQLFDFDPNGSGRYRQGSGQNPNQHGFNFLAEIEKIKKENPGISNTKIAELMGYTTTEWRDRLAYNTELKKAHDKATAKRWKYERQMSPKSIAEELKISEGTVRNYLKEADDVNNMKITNTMNALKESLKNHPYLDVGEGTARFIGVSEETLRAAVLILQDQGYVRTLIQVPQINPRQYKQKTDMIILGPPGKTKNEQAKDVYSRLDEVHYIGEFYSPDKGTTLNYIQKPAVVDSSRIKINYADAEGYQPKDGVIELRPGVADLDLGRDQVYSQVRINVDDKYYLKGMAIYNNNMPKGVDIIFNTNKQEGTPMEKVFKGMKRTKVLEDGSDDPNSPIDWTNPFGSSIQAGGQSYYIDKDGTKKLSAINKVNKEGTWDEWNKNLSSQFLSKQPKEIAKQQLNISYLKHVEDLENIMSIPNNMVRQKMLNDFADSCEEDSANLKAWAMPRQTTKVLLPAESLKENECYCPDYRNGEKLVLIRHPHSGPTEILELKVNNNNKECRDIYGSAPKDLIAIPPKRAAKLSGADFDGDSAVVIPNNKGLIRVAPMLKQLEGFDPKIEYKTSKTLKRMSDQTKGLQMGMAANLIGDMTLIGCPDDELARAIKYSMVVIDAQKHGLDWKQAAKDLKIKDLRIKYQGKPGGGAATLITRAKGPEYVPERKLYTKIDPETGDKIPGKDTGALQWKPKSYNEDGTVKEWVSSPVKTKTKRMYEVKDAYDLVSDRNNPYPMEIIYADYANQMKDLARKSRLESIKIEKEPKNSSASKVYEEEVVSLEKKLKNRQDQAPADRLALRIATTKIKALKDENPNLPKEKYKKKSAQYLSAARTMVIEGGKKEKISITPKEWEAIEAKAISDTMLEKILRYADEDQVREYASPKKQKGNMFSPSQIARMKAYLNAGFTLSDVADEFGVSVSTIKKYSNEE